ncbi:hypothetical protein [Anaerococcus sp. Marseille-P3625]|uniref:hypothetical protein n=1 Tax=Anaerococcus sp. Marseille-P3625 TaxID=1977277 RepID=UPI000C0831B7|nr:hypothetical protein [Anaerococcus sp. Marseille-P3625]
MSGGCLSYICYTIENNLVGEMQDEFMNEFVKDFAELTHDLEWWLSRDYGEETYRESLKEFKNKWFKNYDKRENEAILRIKERAIREISEL